MIKIELGNNLSDLELDRRISKSDFFIKINYYRKTTFKKMRKEIKCRNKEIYEVIYAHYYPNELILVLWCKFKLKEEVIKENE